MASKFSAKNPYPLYTAILTWAGFIILASMYSTIPITDAIMASLSVEKTEAVLLTSFFSISYGISCLFFGPLSDRYGRKILLVIGLCILTVLSFILFFITHYPLLIFIRVLQGAASAMVVPTSLAYTADVYPASKRLGAIAVISSGFLTSSVLAQVFSLIVESKFNWQMIFLILGILYAFTTICIYFFIPKEKQHYKSNSLMQQFKEIKFIIRHPDLVICFFISFTLLFSLVGMYSMLGNYFSNEPYYFNDEKLLLIRAVGLIGVILCFFANNLSKVFGILKVLRFGLILSAVSLYTIGNIHSPIFAAIFSALFVAGISLIVPANINLVSTYGELRKGTAVLFNAFILFAGASLGPLIAAKLTAHFSFFIAFFMFSLLLLIAFLLSFYLSKEEEY